MQRLDIFKHIDVLIDKMDGAPDDRDVKVTVVAEERRFRLNVGTGIQKNDVGCVRPPLCPHGLCWQNASGQLFNVFGRAETLDIAASTGLHSTTPFSLAFTKPLGGDPARLLRFTLGSLSSRYPAEAKYCSASHAAALSVRLPSVLRGASHELGYGLDWRTLHALAPSASPSLRRAAGHSLKSALSHTWTLDRRDDPVFPTSGHLLRLSQEVAGGPIGGDAQHIRSELFGSVHTALPGLPACILSLSMRAGSLHNAHPSKASFYLDRFQMGGPTSVRGFDLNSIGPKDQRDPLGGDLMLEAGASLSFPVAPSLVHMVRGHVFANAGMLGFGVPVGRFLRETPPNVSVGAGLLIKMSPSARIELNLAYPVCNPSGRAAARGIQLGIGLEFL